MQQKKSSDEKVEITVKEQKQKRRKVIHHVPEGFWSAAHIWTLLLRLPKALAPTLVGTKLLLPIPPDRLRKSARRWVTQVAVLQARFCAVTLLQESKGGVNAKIWCDIYQYNTDTHKLQQHFFIFININFTAQKNRTYSLKYAQACKVYSHILTFLLPVNSMRASEDALNSYLRPYFEMCSWGTH